MRLLLSQDVNDCVGLTHSAAAVPTNDDVALFGYLKASDKFENIVVRVQNAERHLTDIQGQ